MASGIAAQNPPTTSRRDRTHWLYLAVIGAVPLGIAVGFLFPEFAVGAEVARHRLRRPDQDDHRAGHLLHDRARHRLDPDRPPKVGRVGGLALGYFMLMSTVALAIGLVVGNLLAPRATACT